MNSLVISTIQHYSSMIIDVHTHIGEISFPVGKSRISNMPEETLIAGMIKYSIDFALVSSIEGAEFNSDVQLVPPEKQIPQLVSMSRVVEFVRKNRTRLKALLWVKPYTEECGKELDDFIQSNKEYIAGLKIHPTLSNLKFTDKKILPFIRLARKFNFPVLIHTENDGRSNAGFVEKVAGEFRDVTFIMAHMGLNTDNLEAIDIIKRNQNIFGDTCLVESGNVIRAIDECGSESIIFGTDASVFGIDTYERYLPLISTMKSRCSVEDVKNVLYKNSMRLYGLNNLLPSE